ncbi:MAG: YheU family protein [Desulfuromonadales bacterium]|jgi:uncharacterized protein YheU (UPF0270 family)
MAQETATDHREDGVDLPWERINPDTLRNLVREFVTRDGSDWGDAAGTLEAKVEQVFRQLRENKVKVVFDLRSQTANIVICR